MRRISEMLGLLSVFLLGNTQGEAVYSNLFMMMSVEIQISTVSSIVMMGVAANVTSTPAVGYGNGSTAILAASTVSTSLASTPAVGYGNGSTAILATLTVSAPAVATLSESLPMLSVSALATPLASASVMGNLSAAITPSPNSTVVPTTAPPTNSTPTIQTYSGLVLLTVSNKTVAEFSANVTEFKRFVAESVSNHCVSALDDCQAVSARKRRTAFNIDENDVIIVSLVQDGSNVNVTFYVITPSGSSAVPALQIVEALQSNSTQIPADLQALGFKFLYLAAVNSVTTATAVTESPTEDDSDLSTAVLIAIVCGSVGGVILIIMIICVIYFVVNSKQTSKVKPLSSGRNGDTRPLRSMKKPALLESVTSSPPTSPAPVDY